MTETDRDYPFRMSSEIEKAEMPNLANIERKKKEWNNEISHISFKAIISDEITKGFQANTIGLRMKFVFGGDSWKLKQFLNSKAKISYGEIYNYKNPKGVHKKGSFCLA